MYRLDVPYREKDEAKAYGAKWNFMEKYWYCEELTDDLRTWYKGSDEDNTASEQEANVSVDEASLNSGKSNIEDQYKTVSQINDMIKNHYDRAQEFYHVMVKGEVTNYSGPNRGNHYFSLKDEHALINCFIWQSETLAGLKFKLERGQQVAIIGNLEYYAATGRSQLHAKRMINLGEGEQNLELLRLRQRLLEEGLFDPAHKKSIPTHPTRVGILTSKDGKAKGDICEVGRRRNPYIQFYLYPVSVQGVHSVPTVVAGLKKMDAMGLDAIIVTRGGGSDEELKAYNDEAIVRAVYEAKTPIISAVGHEEHWMLVDEAADRRCSTPSEAAMVVCPDVMTDIRSLESLTRELKSSMRNAINRRQVLLQTKLAALERFNPRLKLKQQQERLVYLTDHLKVNINSAFEQRKHRYDLLLSKLNGLSPTAKLINGFGYISAEDKPVVSAKNLSVGDDIQIIIHDGEIGARVTQLKTGNNYKI